MIKMVDTAVPMNEEGYPVARAKHIWLDDDTNLQKAIDDGSLGGGDNSVTITEQEYQVLTDEEKYNGLYYCYDVGKIYKNGVEYARSPIVTVTETEDGYNVDIEDVSGVQSFEIPNGKNAVQFTPSITENGELAWENDGELENPPTTPIQQVYANTPIGTVLSFAGQTAPNGYLLADGASYPTAEYPDLYAVIGNTYGGDTENFNVPNLVDKFIQGSTTSGTEKEAGLPNITGEAWIRVREGSSTGDSIEQTTGAFTRGDSHGYQRASATSSSDPSASLKIDASLSNPIYGNSDTVQPPALTMVYIIKAFHTNEGVDSGVSDDVVEYVDSKINDSSTNTVSTWSSSKIASEIDNAILTKDIIYKGALTANTRKVIATTIGVDLSKIVSISKIFGDTLEGWDYGICQMTSAGELIYMPTATTETSHIQIRIAYRE